MPLYVVATPIGNLEDVTLRALRVLKESDLIACEDTRRTRVLLARFGILTPTTSYFEHNKARKGPYLLGLLRAGKTIALVTDAGTPGIRIRDSCSCVTPARRGSRSCRCRARPPSRLRSLLRPPGLAVRVRRVPADQGGPTAPAPQGAARDRHDGGALRVAAPDRCGPGGDP